MKPYRPLTYLASPYTPKGSDAETTTRRILTRADRYAFVADATAALFCRHPHWNVFSPIVHSHPLHTRGLDGDWTFWRRVDTQFLRLSCRVVVLQLPGWAESTGVTAELEIARKLGLPIYYCHPISYELAKKPFNC